MDLSNAQNRGDIIQLLSHVPLFASLDLREHNFLIEKCNEIAYGADEVVVDEGEIGDKVYVIVQGSVLVSKDNPSEGWEKIAILHQGDFFGEIAVLRHVTRTARVSTISPCVFLTIGAADVLEAYKYFSDKHKSDIQLIIEKRLAELR